MHNHSNIRKTTSKMMTLGISMNTKRRSRIRMTTRMQILLTRGTWWVTSMPLHKNRGRVSPIRLIYSRMLIQLMQAMPLGTKDVVWWVNSRSKNRFTNNLFRRFRGRPKTILSPRIHPINKIDHTDWIRCQIRKLAREVRSKIISMKRKVTIRLMSILTNTMMKWPNNKDINKRLRNRKTTLKRQRILTRRMIN